MDLTALAAKYSDATMIHPDVFVANLELVDQVADVAGAVIECGTWRGGMLAAMAEMRPQSPVLGFDSFEGLPPAQAIDGDRAIRWQADTEAPGYFDNCTASLDEFQHTFGRVTPQRLGQRICSPGWFADTVPAWARHEGRPLAVLRLDGDWYESTKICLEHLYPLLVPGGLLIVDDFGTWDGCTHACDEYLGGGALRLHRGVWHLFKAAR